MRAPTHSLLALLLSAPLAHGQDDIAFPDGFQSWRHVKTMLIGGEHPLYGAFGGIHHIYADETALEGYKSGDFPQGATIVFDLLEAVERDGAVVEGRRKVTAVVERDTAVFDATGGWGFQAFEGGDPARPGLSADDAAGCFACHEVEAARDSVFSSLRD